MRLVTSETKRRKVKVDCLFCGREFEARLRWEGHPERDYCSAQCEREDEEFEGEDTFEKFTKQGNDEWA